MATKKVDKIKPEVYAQTCPNCNGRGTVGHEKRPCPTCGKTETPGIVYVPVKINGGTDENEDSIS
jgi:DnaJ-class molecular chaperone